MAEEIQEAVQIIRVAYDGIEIAMKVGSGGIAAMQKAIDFLKGMLDYEKSLGKTSMRKLILKGGDLQVLQFNTEDMKKVEKMAKKYGIPSFSARESSESASISTARIAALAAPSTATVATGIPVGIITVARRASIPSS